MPVHELAGARRHKTTDRPLEDLKDNLAVQRRIRMMNCTSASNAER